MRENKKGNILKKKAGLIGRISLMIALLFTAIGFSFIGNYKRSQEKSSVAVVKEIDGVGVVDDSNIVLSVTKVAVNANGATNPLDTDSKHAFTNYVADGPLYNDYYYRDIPDLENNQSRTIVKNGQFVKLNNNKDGKVLDSEPYYNFVPQKGLTSFESGINYYKIMEVDGIARMELRSESSPIEGVTYYKEIEVKSKLEVDKTVNSENFGDKKAELYKVVGGNFISCSADTNFSSSTIYYVSVTPSAVDMQEAILITFGQECFTDGKLYYPINSLFVEVYHNGNQISVPTARSEGYKRDFGFIIGQDDDNEGYYKVVVKSEYFNQKGIKATDDIVFDFYLINDTTYTGSYVEEGNNNEYSAKPSLSLADGSEIGSQNGKFIYNLGSSSKEFPVLNYDYSLYKMNYTHTLDGATAEYSYTYKPELNQIEIVKNYKKETTILDPINLKKGFSSNNLVLLFSEIGDYEFSFEYIYSGYPYDLPTSDEKYKVIDNMNESLSSIKLEINGFETSFSKKNYFGGAEMRYLTLNTSDKVYFKVVDGYPRANVPAGVDSLGIMYSESSDVLKRTGVVTAAQDTNILTQLSLKNSVSDYEYLYKNVLNKEGQLSGNNIIENTSTNPEANRVLKILNELTYETTDQNPVKLKSNTNFLPFNKSKAGSIEQGSFYIYSGNQKISSSTIFDYEQVDSPVDANIRNYYEFIDGNYIKTTDTSVKASKYYYQISNEIDCSQYDKVLNKDHTKFKKYYELINGVYTKSDSIEGNTYSDSKTYYTLDKGYVAKYTSDTSFNEAGYYLVFLAVAEGDGDDRKLTNYQVIAFNNVLQDVSMSTVECNENGDSIDKAVQNPEFTDDFVKLSWEEPDVFEMGLTIKYYYREYGNIFTGVYTENDLKNGTAVVVSDRNIHTEIKDGKTIKSCIIGKEIGSQESGKYLIVISNEKGNEWTTSFTIDKQDITGISGYGVFENDNSFSLSKNPIQGFITNTIEDVYGATISWNDKPSGAKVYAKYQTISFVSNPDEIKELLGEEGKITTNFKTNNDLDGSYDIFKPINNLVDEDNVLYPQGIYIFNFIDEAGNEAKYLLILDNTQTYFKVTENDKNGNKIENAVDPTYKNPVYRTAEWLQYNDVRLNIEVPKYKMIALDATTMTKLEEEGFDDYINNNETLKSLFAEFAESWYIQVKQNQVVEYNTNSKEINNVSPINNLGTDMWLYIESVDEANKSKIVWDYDHYETDYGTSVIRTYYIRGENQKYINSTNDITKSNSYIKVEINPDNSKGYVFFSSAQLTNYPNIDTEQNIRLDTQATLKTSHMTNDNFVLFTWIMDIGGKYEVGEVKFDYYPLNLSQFNENYYFFDNSPSSVISKTVYSKDGVALTTEQIKTDNQGNERGFVTLNVENNMSQAGYYVVTRTYADTVKLDADSNDVMEMKYHFIVDRNGIISMVDGQEVGKYIHFGLLENETEFNDFSQYTSMTPSIFTIDGNDISYNPSLETNKLPAVVNIPIGKYNNSNGEYSDYYAGHLTFTMYFFDEYNQLGNGKKPYPLFKVQENLSSLKKELINGDEVYYYPLNVREYIQNLANLVASDSIWATSGLRDFFTNSAIGNDWLCLPGDYVIVINDRAEGSSLPNSETIAFTIRQQAKPETPVYVTPDQNYSTDSLPNETTIYSSQQWIKVDFPTYDKENTDAQIYSVTYLGKTYTVGESDDDFTQSADGSKWTLKVNKMTDLSDLYKGEGKYTFSVKYKLINDNYKYCYVAYNNAGIKESYYDNTYTVVIDRTAPVENVNNLIANDNIASNYGGNEIFEQAYYNNTANETTTYFVNRYANYYKNGQDRSDIFAFVVTDDTDFNSTDVKEVRYKSFDIVSGNLSLPAVNLNGYELIEKYSDLPTNGYFEILETDNAGNTTQYVVLYLGSGVTDYDKIEIGLKASLVDGEKTLTISNLTEKDGSKKTLISYDEEKTNFVTLLSLSEDDLSLELKGSPADRFYVMEIFKEISYRKIKIHEEKTNFNENNLHSVLVNTIKENGVGNYTVYIHSRSKRDTTGIDINYVEKVVDFDISNIVKTNALGNKYLDLAGANQFSENVTYYIQTIEYKRVGDSSFIKYEYKDGDYYDKDGKNVQGNIVKDLSGDYILITKDMFGRKLVYTFSTDKDATEKIEGTLFRDGDVYYSYQPIDILYVDGLYERDIEYTIDGGELKRIDSTELEKYYEAGHILFNGKTRTENGYRKLTFNPYYPKDTNTDGKIVRIKVTLSAEIEGLEQRFVYNICFDTRTGVVRLINTRNGIDQIINMFENSTDKSSWINTTMTSGIMNLTWLKNPSENHKLKYFLYEKIDDSEQGWIDPIDLTNDQDNVYVIQTKDDDKGLYAFEVQVWSKDGSIYLGNKVYVFMVKSDTSDLFTVQSATKEYDSNSRLKDADYLAYIDYIKTSFGVSTLPSDMPLYIANEELEVVEDSGQGVQELKYVIDYGGGYILTIYREYTTSYNQYLATLQVPVSPDLIDLDSLKVNNQEITKDPVLLEGRDEVIDLTFTQSLPIGLEIAKKNLIRLEVWFNDEKVKDHFATNHEIYYEIKGSGLYTFKIYDIAGNCQIFENEVDSFDVYALSNNELALLMNGKAVIENGYFSQPVQIAVVKDGLYDSINVSATRNGSVYSYSKVKQVYTFKDAGTYRVRIAAKYGDKTLTKTLIFTVVDPEVTSNSINLSLLEQYQLVEVINENEGSNYVENVTDLFKTVLNKSSKGGFVTYEALKEESDTGVFSGKQKFILTYKVSDGIYPDRTQTFEFSLSNEVPMIKCSLKPGESSNKKFTVTYNPGFIYEQIGKSSIFINDIEISINANSPKEIQNITVTQKAAGSGEYTIRLVSGENVLFSQTVKLKAPLNASSIIIIIVVSAVVIAGVVTFILLRRKMRIR